MKILIYISGIEGSPLRMLRSIVTVGDFSLNIALLIIGLVILIFIPLLIIDKYLQNRKINNIIDSYKKTKKKTIHLERGESKTKGWGINNSPFRERRSGVNWGGGNIKGANATRGTRKSFLLYRLPYKKNN